MTKTQLEKILLEMINSSKMIINRRDFRTLYFVSDLKKIRLTKLNRIFNSNNINNNTKFSECDSFMSIYYKSDYILIQANIKTDIMIKQVFSKNFNDINIFFEAFLSKYYNIDFSKREVSYYQFTNYDIHLSEDYFDYSFPYKEEIEDESLVFEFNKYKFDICNYSYHKIVKLFY